MLIRLTDYVERGVIDNRKQGSTLLKFYFKDIDKPLVIELEGDCHKDIAGSRVQFTLREGYRDRLVSPPPIEPGCMQGTAGDITGSRRSGLAGKGMPLNNVLYIEAFVEPIGLILFESPACELVVSPYEWTMDSCEEQVQIMCNQHVMREYVQQWIKRFAHTREDEDPLPDHHWDVRLREAEGVAIAFQEVHFKYRHDPCGDTSEAFIMGWDDMLGELADSDENGTAFSRHIAGALSLFDILDDNEAIEAQLCMSHPLFQQVINITETSQKLFSKQINELQFQKKMPPEELGILFHAIRYVTPNILSCLLQMDDPEARYDVLAERMARCAKQIARALAKLPGIAVEGLQPLQDLLEVLHQDILRLSGNLLKQGRIQS